MREDSQLLNHRYIETSKAPVSGSLVCLKISEIQNPKSESEALVGDGEVFATLREDLGRGGLMSSAALPWNSFRESSAERGFLTPPESLSPSHTISTSLYPPGTGLYIPPQSKFA
jgi:hypothetical protein